MSFIGRERLFLLNLNKSGRSVDDLLEAEYHEHPEKAFAAQFLHHKVFQPLLEKYPGKRHRPNPGLGKAFFDSDFELAPWVPGYLQNFASSVTHCRRSMIEGPRVPQRVRNGNLNGWIEEGGRGFFELSGKLHYCPEGGARPRARPLGR